MLLVIAPLLITLLQTRMPSPAISCVAVASHRRLPPVRALDLPFGMADAGGAKQGTAAPALPRDAFSELKSRGFAVVPGFVPEGSVDAILNDMSKLRTEGRFSKAGVGESSTNRLDDLVRECEQCFLFPKYKHQGGGDSDGRSTLYGMLDSVREQLSAGCGVALDPLLTEGLYARYPHGGFYRRHIDAVQGTASDQRQWSYLLYLNKDWAATDGGCLRIHTDGGGEVAPAGAAPSYVDVEPRAGTLVLFRSTIAHEVLDTAAQRMAVAGWFNTPVEGSSTRRTLIAGLAGALLVGSGVKSLLGGEKD
tara:strand:+ start:1683 stop:2603 length:921 start_codon:yes stop_codon:yes gene_type:complete